MNLAGAHVDARRHCSRCRASYTDEFEICPRDGQRLTAGKDPLIGLVLAGTYRVASLIGEGGLGSVYLADHLRVPRTYAVKFPRGMWVDHPKSRARFINEAMAAGRLDHPNIASVIDHGETEHGVPYLVMEHARGEMLSEHLLRRGPIPVDEALELLRPIALGLAHAHSWGVVHRDLKPDNIVIEAARPRIVDFGIAILADLGDSGRFTTKGVVIGTPYYMAPEQLLGDAIDARADLYALGVILFEMLAGCRPYSGTAVEIAHQTVSGPAPSFTKRAPWLNVDPAVERLCRGLLARQRDERLPNAEAVVAAIDEILASRRGATVRLEPENEAPRSPYAELIAAETERRPISASDGVPVLPVRPGAPTVESQEMQAVTAPPAPWWKRWWKRTQRIAR